MGIAIFCPIVCIAAINKAGMCGKSIKYITRLFFGKEWINNMVAP